MKTILFANTDWYLFNYRLPFAQALKDAGHDLLLLSPDGKYAEKINEAGFTWRKANVSRRGINPIREMRSIIELVKIYKGEHPEIVHHFTVKCVLYGSLAARLSGIQYVINAVTGLGYIFSTHNFFTNLARPIVKYLYKWLLKGSLVIFQNQRDFDYFVQNRLADKAQCVLIPGSGVDVDIFKPSQEKAVDQLIVLPSRMLWDKGVQEFVEAAGIVGDSGLKARFALVGDIDEGNPSSIPIEKLRAWQQEGIIEWWGWQEDMVKVYQSAAIVCLPSYSEGLAKSLIEAAACGKALIASDIPGCREVIDPGVNGLLVPKGDADALAKSIMKILPDKEQLRKMGAASRKIAVDNFSTARIVSETLNVYNYLKKPKRQV